MSSYLRGDDHQATCPFFEFGSAVSGLVGLLASNEELPPRIIFLFVVLNHGYDNGCIVLVFACAAVQSRLELTFWVAMKASWSTPLIAGLALPIGRTYFIIARETMDEN